MTPGTRPCQATGAPAGRVWEEGGEQKVGGASGRRQSSRGSWDTCPSTSLWVLLTLSLSGLHY